MRRRVRRVALSSALRLRAAAWALRRFCSRVSTSGARDRVSVPAPGGSVCGGSLDCGLRKKEKENAATQAIYGQGAI